MTKIHKRQCTWRFNERKKITFEDAFANNLQRTADPPSIGQFFRLAKLGGLGFQFQDLPDGRLGDVVAVQVDGLVHHAVVDDPHGVQA